MGSIWTKIKNIFKKKHKENTVAAFEMQELVYEGNEPECWACGSPIHKTHKSRKINKRKVHTRCFKKLKKILLSGNSLNAF